MRNIYVPDNQSIKNLNVTGKNLSSVLVCKFYRDDNVVTGDILVDYFDIHFEQDGLGSDEEYTKL